MMTLSENGKRDAFGVLFALALVAGVFWSGMAMGKAQAKDAADAAAEAKVHIAVVAAKASADSLLTVSANLTKLAAASRATVVHVEAKTDTAHLAEDRARDFALATLKDSLSTIATLRLALDTVTRADSVLNARFAAERAANQQALIDHKMAMDTAGSLIRRLEGVIKLDGDDRTALLKEIADLKSNQPGVVHRFVHGVLVVTAAAGCGGLGTIGGPAVAIGAAVVCGGVAGAFSP